MKLSEVFQKLSFGHLRELAVAVAGSINSDDQPTLCVATNTALIALYTRFPLMLRELELETVDGRFEYPLRRDFALTSGSAEPIKFIKDSAGNLFTGDVLKVVGIIDGTSGDPLPLNDRNHELSWFTAAYDVLRMGYPKTGDRYLVEYRAKHDDIPVVVSDPTQVEIAVPSVLETALLHHIAGTIYGGMSIEGALGKSQMHMAAYEAECGHHEQINTFDQWFAPSNLKPEIGGWV